MPRGTTLATLRGMLKAAIGDNATGNTGRDTELNTLLSNEQKLYASSFDFPFLRHRWDLNCSAGSRFLALPTTTSSVGDLGAAVSINFDRPVKVMTKWNGDWLEVHPNITEVELSVHDSDIDERMDPIQRWQLATNTSEAAHADEIEIWPIPTFLQTLRFVGQRQVLALAADADKADLDDMLLVYSVAVKKATRANLIEEAKLHLATARQRELQIRSSYPKREQILIMGCPTHGEAYEQRRYISLGSAGGVGTQEHYDGVWDDPNGNITPTTQTRPAMYSQLGSAVNIWRWDTVALVWYPVITP